MWSPERGSQAHYSEKCTFGGLKGLLTQVVLRTGLTVYIWEKGLEGWWRLDHLGSNLDPIFTKQFCK